MAKFCSLLSGICALCIGASALATPPSETLLPNTTKAYFSVPDMQELGQRWSETQLGRLTDDPLMKPFADDLREQIQGKLSGTRVRLGLSVEDLKGIYGGEMAMAVVQPGNDRQQHATVLLVDVTGHVELVREKLAKVRENLLAQGARERVENLAGAEVNIFTLPRKREDSPVVEPHYVLHQQTLIVTDHAAVCQAIIQRLNGQQEGAVLRDDPAFKITLERCAADSGQLVPHIRWFVEPFGYALTARQAAGGRKRKGPDLLRILPSEGFSAIQGVGGHICFATGDEEIVHRTMVYAPPVATGEQRYARAARMLDFPNNDILQPQDFVSRDLGSYFTFNWKMKDAFEYSKTLVNALLGGEEDGDLMEDIIAGLALDKDGPQVDLRKDLVAHFAERASMITDCRRPITPDSERLLVAVELTNPEAVRATIDKAFDTDPDAEKREYEGHVIWEIIKDAAPADVEELQIEGDDIGVFNPFEPEPTPVAPAEDNQGKILPNSAITVANGHLIVATHVDFVVEMLQRPLGTDLLRDAADYQLIDNALAKIGAGPSSFRFFARTDETYRPTYELIRQGKMPESKTVLGRVLNQLLGPDEEGILREQEIDGAKMPEFDAVRRYLGPSGMYVQSEPDGWFMAGCLLSKELR